MCTCRKDFDETNYMSFFTKIGELLEKYNLNLITKIESYEGKFDLIFHDN